MARRGALPPAAGPAGLLLAGLLLAGIVLAAAGPVRSADKSAAPPSSAPSSPTSSPPASAPSSQPAFNAWAAYLSARHASRQKNAGLASRHFATVTPWARGHTALMVRALRSHIIAGRMDRAPDLARAIAAVAPDQAMARLVLTLDAARNGRFAAAQSHLGRLTPDGLNRLLLPLMQAWLALGRHGDPDLALDEHRELVGDERFQLFRLLHRAYLLDVAGRMERAAQAYRAIPDAPAFLALRTTETLASFFARSGERAAAFRAIDRHLAAAPESMPARALRARYLGDGPAPAPIRSAADGLAEVLINVAGAFEQAERLEEALPLARLAVWMRPGDAASRYLLGGILDGDSRYRDAIAVFDAMQADTVYGWEARKSAAVALVALDRHAEAAAKLEDMAGERPERSDALWLLGNVHRNRSAFGAAVKVYDRAVGRVAEIADRHWNLLYARGIALERSGEWARAEADFLHALRLNPGQPYVLNYLAYSWVDRGERLEEAREMLEEAVRRRPKDGYIVDSVGWVEYRLGNFDAAVRHLERAVELRPHDPIINRHLGDAYWRAGRRREARFQWRRALWLGPEEDERPPTEQRLRDGLPPFEPVPQQ